MQLSRELDLGRCLPPGIQSSFDEQIEAAIAGGLTSAAPHELDLGEGLRDRAIIAFDAQIVEGPLRRVVTSGEKIIGKVLDGTKIVEEAFLVQKELLIKAKQSQLSRELDLGRGSPAFIDPGILLFDEQIEPAIAGGLTSAVPHELDLGEGLRDRAIIAFDAQIVEGPLRRVVTCAEKIGGKVLESTKILEEAFLVQRELLIKAKQFQKPNKFGMTEFRKPLTLVTDKAKTLIRCTWRTREGLGYLNHLESTFRSHAGLHWIAYLSDVCGTCLPAKYVEESWLQHAEFYYNEVLEEYTNKEPDHVEWAKALKELYIPNLRDFVHENYPLGLEWGPAGSAPIVPAPPPPPPKPWSPSPKCKLCMSRDINSKPVTAGSRKVTDKEKIASCEAGLFSFEPGTPRMELQMGCRWVVENQVGKKDLVIEDCDSKQSIYVHGCKDCVIQVKGKVNNITVEKCTQIELVFTDTESAPTNID